VSAPLDRHLTDRVDPTHLEPLTPIDDIRGSAGYRRGSVLVLLRRLLAGFAP
jgi:hypothetical protein